MQRQKAKSDEWYTPRSAVEAIVPYLKNFKNIMLDHQIELTKVS